MSWHDYKVVARGDWIRCFVDGALVFAWLGKKPAPPKGAVGLRTWATAARFRNVKVTAPDSGVLFSGIPNLSAVPPTPGLIVDAKDPSQPPSQYEYRCLKEQHGRITCVAFGADDDRVLTGCDCSHLHRYAGNNDGVYGAPAGNCMVWSLASGLPTVPLQPGPSFGLAHIATSPDGKRLVSCAPPAGNWPRNTVFLWDIEKASVIHRFKENSGPIIRVGFSQDGRSVVAGGADGSFWVWDARSGALRSRVEPSQPAVLALDFSKDGNTAFVSRQDGTLRVASVHDGKELCVCAGKYQDVRTVALSPDGQNAVTGHNDGTIRLWDLKSRKDIRTFEGHEAPVTALAFSRDGQRVLSGSGFGDASVRLWDVRTGRELLKLCGHCLPVTGVAFSRSGKLVASSSRDRTARVWRLPASLVSAWPALAPATNLPAATEPKEHGFVPLFNGKDLTGWSVDGGLANQWSVEGNTIVGHSNDFRTRNYLLTEQDYTDFVLRFDFKIEDGSHGGVAIRAIEGEKVPLRDMLIFDHPIIKLTNPAIEEKEPTGMAHWLMSAAAYVHPIEVLPLRTGIWHSMELVVRGNNCTATLGGKKLVDLTLDPDPRSSGAFVPGLGRRKGKVGFQINTGILRFRKIEIKELPLANPDKSGAEKNPTVTVETSLGKIKIELYPDNAPLTVENFLTYVDEKFYDGTIFHRVIDKTIFVIQGGGFTAKEHKEKDTKAPIKNESDNGLSNTRGSIAMARTNQPNSATSQFYINVADNSKFFDRANARDRVGYCVFGKVIEGMDVVDKIKAVKTDRAKVVTKQDEMEFPNMPVEDVVIKSIRRIESAGLSEDFLPLFNGKDLSGWKTRPQDNNNWRVENGVLIGTNPTAATWSICSTERDDFADFYLRVEARCSDRNFSMIVLPPNYAVFINSNNENSKRTGSLASLPTWGVVTAFQEQLVAANQWFLMEMDVQGTQIIVKVNGRTTANYAAPQRLHERGKINFFVNNIGNLQFRKIEIKELPAR